MSWADVGVVRRSNGERGRGQADDGAFPNRVEASAC
jgi:hypothetical protein